MKLLLFILGLTLCAAWPTVGRDLATENEEYTFGEVTNFEWLFDTPFSPNEEGQFENNEEYEPEQWIEEPPEENEEDLLSEIRRDAVASDVLDFGVNAIVNKGIKDGKIPNTTFTVNSVFNYSKTEGQKGDRYNFTCQATNSNESSVLNMTFSVYYQLSSQNKTLSSSSYNIRTNTTTPTNPNNTNITYTELSQAEIQGAEVQSVLDYGTDQIIKSGYAKNKIPVSEYQITKVNSVSRGIGATRTTYKCDAELEDAEKVLIKAQFTVYVKASNQEKSIGGWTYTVSNIKNTGSGSENSGNTNNTNTTTPTTPTTPTTNSTNNTGNNNNNGGTTNTTTGTGSTNTTTQPTNNTIPTTNTTTTDGYTQLSQAEIQNSQEVQNALAYASQQVIQYGYNKSKIPVSDYKISKVNSVAVNTQTKGKNVYKCDVELQDARGVLVKEQFTVSVRTSNQEKFLNTWSYQIFNLRYANNNSTNSTNTTTTTNTTVPVKNTTNTTNNNGGTTNTSTGTGTTNTNTTTTTPTQPANNSTNTSSLTFTELDPAEIQSSQEVQDAIAYATQQIIQSGTNKSKIPVSNYKVSKINSVAINTESKGKNIYKCDVELQDANKVLVKTQFTVSVKISNQEKSLSGWTYQVSNIKKTNNTNTTTTNSSANKTN